MYKRKSVSLTLRLIFALISVGSLFSCKSSNSDSQKVDVNQNADKDTQKIGPYNVSYNDQQIFENSFETNRITSDGSVIYNLPSIKSHNAIIESLNLQVTGCSASDVQFHLYFIPDYTNNPTQGYEVLVHDEINVNKNQSSALMASFKNITGCEKIKFGLKLTQTPSLNKISGTWNSNTMAAQDPYHVMTAKMSKQNFSTYGYIPLVQFSIQCEYGNTETFYGQLTSSDDSQLPYRLSFKILQISSYSSSPCTKQFGLKSYDVGKTIYCIHNRSSEQSGFNFACQLEGNGKSYPAQYTDVSTTWSRQ